MSDDFHESVQPGDDPDDAAIAELLDAVASLQAGTSDGRRMPPRPALVEQFAAIVRDTPCSTGGVANYSDARYFLDRAVPRRGLRAADAFDAEWDALPGVRQCLTATNLAELTSGSHLLTRGTIVQVFALYTRATPASKVYVFNQPPTGAVVVQITGNADGGKYVGNIVSGSSTAAAGGNLAMPEGMQISGTPALVLNPAEDGLSTHLLQSGTFHAGKFIGTNPSGQSIVAVDCMPLGKTAGPTTIGGAAEGGEDADSATWTRNTDGTPVTVNLVSRVVYDEANSQTLFAYVRQLSFDACGLLISVSAESRYTVDATEPC